MNKKSKKEDNQIDTIHDLRQTVGKGKKAPKIIKSLFGPREYSVLKAKAIVRGLILLLGIVLVAEFLLISDTVLPDSQRYSVEGPPVTTYEVPPVEQPAASIAQSSAVNPSITQTVNRQNLFSEQGSSQKTVATELPPEPEFIDEIEFPPIE